MRRTLIVLILPLTLLLAACSGGSDAPSATDDREPTSPAASADTGASDGDPADTTDIDADVAEADGASDPLAGDLFTSFNPLEVLGGMSGSPALSSDVDPALKDVLLRAGDLPAGYTSMGDYAFSMDSELGYVAMAANMFTSGDVASGSFDAMVMSAAMDMPPEVRAEIEAQGGFDEMSDITDADLQELMDVTDDLGFGFSDVRLLDADGLGDGGVGMHMVMDFGGMIEAFGGPPDEAPLDTIAFDTYMFFEGDQMLMTIVMWPGDGAAPVDSRSLADAMDARAG